MAGEPRAVEPKRIPPRRGLGQEEKFLARVRVTTALVLLVAWPVAAFLRKHVEEHHAYIWHLSELLAEIVAVAALEGLALVAGIEALQRRAERRDEDAANQERRRAAQLWHSSASTVFNQLDERIGERTARLVRIVLRAVRGKSAEGLSTIDMQEATQLQSLGFALEKGATRAGMKLLKCVATSVTETMSNLDKLDGEGTVRLEIFRNVRSQLADYVADLLDLSAEMAELKSPYHSDISDPGSNISEGELKLRSAMASLRAAWIRWKDAGDDSMLPKDSEFIQLRRLRTLETLVDLRVSTWLLVRACESLFEAIIAIRDARYNVLRDYGDFPPAVLEGLDPRVPGQEESATEYAIEALGLFGETREHFEAMETSSEEAFASLMAEFAKDEETEGA